MKSLPPRAKKNRLVSGILVGLTALTILAALGIYHIVNRESTIINPNVVVYTEEVSPFKILASDDDSITVSSLDGISDDAIINAGVTNETPDGLLRRVVSTEPVDNGYRIATAPAALTEAIERCDVRVMVSMAEDGTYTVTETGASASPDPFIQQAFADENTLDNLFSVKEEGLTASAGNMIEVDLKIEFGNVQMRVVDHFQAKLSLDSLNGTFEKTLFDKRLNPFTFMVGPVAVVFRNDLSVAFSADASTSLLGFEGKASMDKKIGFEYSTKRGLKPINEDESEKPDLHFKPGDEFFSMSLNGTLTGTFGSYLYGFAGPELSAMLEAQSDARLHKALDEDARVEYITVPGIDWNLDGRFAAKVNIPVSGTFVLRIPSNPFDTTRDPLELANMEIFDTEDAITLVDIEKQTKLVTVGNHIETKYFSLEVPESWGGNFTFEDHSLSESNRVWWLTPNTLDPFLPEQSDSRGFFGNYITIYVLGANNGNGDMGGLSEPYGAKFQTQELFRSDGGDGPYGIHGGIIYPSQAWVFSKRFFPDTPDAYAVVSPSQQQIDDAAYIVSTFELK